MDMFREYASAQGRQIANAATQMKHLAKYIQDNPGLDAGAMNRLTDTRDELKEWLKITVGQLYGNAANFAEVVGVKAGRLPEDLDASLNRNAGLNDMADNLRAIEAYNPFPLLNRVVASPDIFSSIAHIVPTAASTVDTFRADAENDTKNAEARSNRFYQDMRAASDVLARIRAQAGTTLHEKLGAYAASVENSSTEFLAMQKQVNIIHRLNGYTPRVTTSQNTRYEQKARLDSLEVSGDWDTLATDMRYFGDVYNYDLITSRPKAFDPDAPYANYDTDDDDFNDDELDQAVDIAYTRAGGKPPVRPARAAAAGKPAAAGGGGGASGMPAPGKPAAAAGPPRGIKSAPRAGKPAPGAAGGVAPPAAAGAAAAAVAAPIIPAAPPVAAAGDGGVVPVALGRRRDNEDDMDSDEHKMTEERTKLKMAGSTLAERMQDALDIQREMMYMYAFRPTTDSMFGRLQKKTQSMAYGNNDQVYSREKTAYQVWMNYFNNKRRKVE
jgi:hypothetical protein